MGEKFVGSVDTVLASTVALESGNGAWFNVPAEQHVLELVVGGLTGGPHSVIVESEVGVIHTFTVSGAGTQKVLVSLGGFPGGRRIRGRWTVSGGTMAFDLTARESRDGLAI